MSSAVRPPLHPLLAFLWIWFLVWTVAVALIWLTGFGEAEASEWVGRHFMSPAQREAGASTPLLSALTLMLRVLDPIWITLAAANVYASLVRACGLATARRWALTIFVVAYVIGALSVWHATPMGPLHFTSRLGPRLGPVSLGWPLLWICIFFGARELARRLLRFASHGWLSGATGMLVLGTYLNVEPVASKIRVFWLWNTVIYPPEPAPNGFAFFLVWLLWPVLAYYFRLSQVVSRDEAGLPRAAIVLLLLNVLCLATQLTWRLAS